MKNFQTAIQTEKEKQFATVCYDNMKSNAKDQIILKMLEPSAGKGSYNWLTNLLLIKEMLVAEASFDLVVDYPMQLCYTSL